MPCNRFSIHRQATWARGTSFTLPCRFASLLKGFCWRSLFHRFVWKDGQKPIHPRTPGFSHMACVAEVTRFCLFFLVYSVIEIVYFYLSVDLPEALRAGYANGKIVQYRGGHKDYGFTGLVV